jgi:hypothetical protein
LFKKLLYAVKDFSTIFNENKPKDRYKYLIPIKKAGFTLIEANKLGFNVGKKLWKSNLSLIRNKGGRPCLNLDKILRFLRFYYIIKQASAQI